MELKNVKKRNRWS